MVSQQVPISELLTSVPLSYRLEHLSQKPSGLGNSATQRMAAGCCPARSPLTYHTLSAQAQGLYFYLFLWYLDPATLKETEESSLGLCAP